MRRIIWHITLTWCFWFLLLPSAGFSAPSPCLETEAEELLTDALARRLPADQQADLEHDLALSIAAAIFAGDSPTVARTWALDRAVRTLMANDGLSTPTPEEVAQEKERLIASEAQERFNQGSERERLFVQLVTQPECAVQTQAQLLQLDQQEARQRLATSGISIATHTGGGEFLVVQDDALPGLFEHPGADRALGHFERDGVGYTMFRIDTVQDIALDLGDAHRVAADQGTFAWIAYDLTFVFGDPTRKLFGLDATTIAHFGRVGSSIDLGGFPLLSSTDMTQRFILASSVDDDGWFGPAIFGSGWFIASGADGRNMLREATQLIPTPEALQNLGVPFGSLSRTRTVTLGSGVDVLELTLFVYMGRLMSLIAEQPLTADHISSLRQAVVDGQDVTQHLQHTIGLTDARLVGTDVSSDDIVDELQRVGGFTTPDEVLPLTLVPGVEKQLDQAHASTRLRMVFDQLQAQAQWNATVEGFDSTVNAVRIDAAISIAGATGVGVVAQGYGATVVGLETAAAVTHGTSHLLRDHALLNQAEVQHAAGLTSQQAVDQARQQRFWSAVGVATTATAGAFGVHAQGLRATQSPALQRTADLSEAAIGGSIVATELGGSLVSGGDAPPAAAQALVFAGGRFASAVAHRTGGTGMIDDGSPTSRPVSLPEQPRQGGPASEVPAIKVKTQTADNGQGAVRVLTEDQIDQLPQDVQTRIAEARALLPQVFDRAQQEPRIQQVLGEKVQNRTFATTDGIELVPNGPRGPESYNKGVRNSLERQHTEAVLRHAEHLEPYGYKHPDSVEKNWRTKAGHAEKKAYMQDFDLGDETGLIAISQAMCSDCQHFFNAEAQRSGKSIVTVDPERIRVFQPDGATIEIPHSMPTGSGSIGPHVQGGEGTSK